MWVGEAQSFRSAHLFLTVLGLCCCSGFFSSCGEWRLPFIAVGFPLQCFSCCGTWTLGHVGSVVVACGLRLYSIKSVVVVNGLSCCMACGVFLAPGSNPCLLHWQADSLLLSQQGSP